MDRVAAPVDILMMQPQHLTFAQTAADGQRVHRVETGCARVRQEGLSLFHRECLRRLTLDRWGVDQVGHVARYQSSLERLVQHFMNHGMDEMDGSAAQPAVQLCRVELL